MVSAAVGHDFAAAAPTATLRALRLRQRCRQSAAAGTWAPMCRDVARRPRSPRQARGPAFDAGTNVLVERRGHCKEPLPNLRGLAPKAANG